MHEIWVPSLGQDNVEKGMQPYSSILAWRMAWTEEPDRLYIVHGVAESDMTEWLSLSRRYNQIKGQSKEQEHLQIKNIEINTFREAKLDSSRVKRRIKL